MTKITDLFYFISSYLFFPILFLKSKLSYDTTTISNSIGNDGEGTSTKPKEYPKEWTELFISSYNNDCDKVLEYLESNVNSINSKDSLGWTALHVAVSNRSINVINLLLERGIDVSIQNDKGYTGFHIAACNGNIDIIEKMITINKVPNCMILSKDMETSLFLSITNNHFEISNMILDYYYNENKSDNNQVFLKFIDQFNVHGVTPLIMSVLRKNLEMIKKLIQLGADINCFKKDNSTPLHCAAIIDYQDAIKLLIKEGGLEIINKVNRYGNTPIHEAAIKGNYQSIKCFIDILKEIQQQEQEQAGDGGNDDNSLLLSFIDLKDKDGSTPLHLCCSCVGNSKNIESNLESIKILIKEGGVDINSIDSGNATGLHILACVAENKALPLVEYFLENGADPTMENKYGWTPIHQAFNNNNMEVYELLIKFIKMKQPNYEIDIKKKRVIPSSSTGNDPYSLVVPEELKKEGLKRLEEISKNIKNGKFKNVIVLTGAGISANAGIPPYRTKDGLLSKNQQFSFSMELLENNPDVFYDTLKNHFLPVIKARNDNDREDGISAGIKSTVSHYFINELHCKYGALLRNYTQNVDPLQERTGTPNELIVHAHGSFDEWYCTVCKKQFDKDRMWYEIGRGGIPFCSERSCRSIIRPGVVFFGEGLSQDFRVNSITDFRKCDLLIVMGTSLIVYPFAGLLNDVAIDVPRILFNFESTGPFVNTLDLERKEKLKQQQLQPQPQQHSQDTLIPPSSSSSSSPLIIESRGKRDVVILGDCDEGVKFFNNILNK